MRIRFVLPAVAAVAALGTATPAMAAASPPSAPASVRGNAFYAARTESAAFQQYCAYAAVAGHAGLAGVWRTVATVEYHDHWMKETALAGRYQSTDNAANLRVAIRQARQTASADASIAARAPRGSSVVRVLRAVVAREAADARLLQEALYGRVPPGPAVMTVPLQVSAGPRYSGSFYADLTDGANSALSDAALNWGEYQYFARNAVNTGQARLARLLSALEAQEAGQNWREISNAAGYVNGDADNLRTSIASEAGAITMYSTFASEAGRAGDPGAAATFTEIRGDEAGHETTFTAELRELAGR